MDIRQLGSAAFFIALAVAAPARQVLAAQVTIDFSLDVTGHDLAWGSSDPNFTPFTTAFSLQFDPTLQQRNSNGQSGEVFFAAGNVFNSPTSGMLPWSTPAALPEYRERNLADFGFEQLSETERQTHMYWDDRYRYDDGAGREYFYGISVETDYQLGEQMNISPDTFDTPDLLSYLQLHQQLGLGLHFGEFAWIWDYNSLQDAAFSSYGGVARITNIDTSAMVPAPPAALLMLSGLSVLRLCRRRPGLKPAPVSPARQSA